MKRTLSLFSLLFVACLTHAQQSALSISYKASIFQPDNVNRTVYTYNYARQWLDQKMDYFKMMQGWDLRYSIQTKGKGFEFGVNRMRASNEATGIQTNGQRGYRKIALKSGSAFVGITRRFYAKKYLHLSYTLSLDWMGFKGFTYYAQGSKDFGASEGGFKNNRFANTGGLNFLFPFGKYVGLQIRPYYQQPWSRANVEGLGEAISGAAGSGTKREYIGNYGCTVGFRIVLGD